MTTRRKNRIEEPERKSVLQTTCPAKDPFEHFANRYYGHDRPDSTACVAHNLLGKMTGLSADALIRRVVRLTP
ncbi:hypothetical protein [Burkholderia cenocepacia]|uniref:hypothetical protein n=1 Tax=Burkholderia cenocepacia TaxID=95486 RepID=UPI002AAFA026|nr:hypothetical protein [Burkholderia cenocepacia]